MDKTSFWKEVKKGNSKTKFTEIDKVRGGINIGNIFQSKYETIFNDVNSQSIPTDYNYKLTNYFDPNDQPFSAMLEIVIIGW